MIRKILIAALLTMVASEASAQSWWDASYLKRRQLTSSDTHSAYSSSTDYVAFSLDTTTGDFQADCDDLRVVHWNGSTNTEIARKFLGCNTTTTKVFFKIPYALSSGSGSISGGTDKMYVYYKCTGCSASGLTYANVNFLQAPLTADANTTVLYQLESEESCSTYEICDSQGSDHMDHGGIGTHDWVTGIVGRDALDCDGPQSNGEYYQSASAVDYDDSGSGAQLTIDFVARIASAPASQWRWMGSNDAWETRATSTPRWQNDLLVAGGNSLPQSGIFNTNTWVFFRGTVSCAAGTGSTRTVNSWWAEPGTSLTQQDTNDTSTTCTVGTISAVNEICRARGDTGAVFTGNIDYIAISNTARGAPNWIQDEVTVALDTAEDAPSGATPALAGASISGGSF